MCNADHADVSPRLRRAHTLARDLAGRRPVTARGLAAAAGVDTSTAARWLVELERLGVADDRLRGRPAPLGLARLLDALERIAPVGGEVTYATICAATDWTYKGDTARVCELRRNHPERWRREIVPVPRARPRRADGPAAIVPGYTPTEDEIRALPAPETAGRRAAGLRLRPAVLDPRPGRRVAARVTPSARENKLDLAATCDYEITIHNGGADARIA
jgi:hypothetical protein